MAAEGYALTCSSRTTAAIPGLAGVAQIRQVANEAFEDKPDWSAALADVDMIIHLAGRVHVSPGASLEQTRLFDSINVQGTRQLARQAVAAGVKRFIYVSTVKVFGGRNQRNPAGDVIPFDENSPAAPQDTYAASKYAAETTLLQIAESKGLQVMIIRPPLVYGPRVAANFLRLMRLVDRGLPLPFAAITNQRSFIFVDNLVDAILTCLRADPRYINRIYVVSDAETRSTPALLRDLADAMNRPVRLFSVPQKLLTRVASLAGQTAAAERLLHSFVVDTGRIARDLDWRAPYSMAQGLAHTARWYCDRHK